MNEMIEERELQEFWEWCGFKYENIADNHIWFTLVYPNGDKETIWRVQPSINLNNLFKYAVPKVINTPTGVLDHPNRSRNRLFAKWIENIEEGMEDTQALYQAIQKVREDK